MTVSVETNVVTYTGNGVTTVFPFTFRVDDADDLYVTLIEIATQVELILNPSLYSVTGIGDDNGGSVTYPLSGSPMANTHQLRLERIVPFTQELAISNQDGFLPAVLEQALDKMTFMAQQVETKADRNVEVYADAAAASAAAAAADAALVEAVIDELIASGTALLRGSGAPSNTLGEDGYLYIDTTNWVAYGPKAAGVWPAGTSLVGPPGAGSGDVTGPASAVINDIPLFNNTNGKVLKTSGKAIGAANGVAPLDGSSLVPVANVPDLAQSKITGLVAALAAKAALTQIDFISGIIETPANKDYKIVVKLPYAITITDITTICTAGSCTLTGKINTTPLGGSANAVTTSEQSQAHASANVAAAGDDIVLTVSANSSCANLSFRVQFTRALAAA